MKCLNLYFKIIVVSVTTIFPLSNISRSPQCCMNGSLWTTSKWNYLSSCHILPETYVYEKQIFCNTYHKYLAVVYFVYCETVLRGMYFVHGHEGLTTLYYVQRSFDYKSIGQCFVQ